MDWTERFRQMDSMSSRTIDKCQRVLETSVPLKYFCSCHIPDPVGDDGFKTCESLAFVIKAARGCSTAF
jgi:hypothetical protein